VSDTDPLSDRVSSLEREVTEIRRDTTDALNLGRVLDRDVSEMRAERRADLVLFHALRDTQVEQGKEFRAGFAKVDQRFANLEAEMRGGFTRVDREMREGFARADREMREGFARVDREMRGGFATMGVGMAQINALLKIAIEQPGDES
jgi:hypothetical protein